MSDNKPSRGWYLDTTVNYNDASFEEYDEDAQDLDSLGNCFNSTSGVEFLSLCFPDVDREMLREILVHHQNNVTLAVEAVFPLIQEELFTSNDNDTVPVNPTIENAKKIKVLPERQFSVSDNLMTLIELFETIEIEKLEQALKSCNGDLEATVTALSDQDSVVSEKDSEKDNKNKKIMTLFEMFPEQSLEELQLTLDSCTGDLDDAIQELVSRYSPYSKAKVSKEGPAPTKRKHGIIQGKNMSQTRSTPKQIGARVEVSPAPIASENKDPGISEYDDTVILRLAEIFPNLELTALREVLEEQGNLEDAIHKLSSRQNAAKEIIYTDELLTLCELFPDKNHLLLQNVLASNETVDQTVECLMNTNFSAPLSPSSLPYRSQNKKHRRQKFSHANELPSDSVWTTKGPDTVESLASLMKAKRLKEMFPTVSPEVIMDIFEEEKYDFLKTESRLLLIGERVCGRESPQNILLRGRRRMALPKNKRTRNQKPTKNSLTQNNYHYSHHDENGEDYIDYDDAREYANYLKACRTEYFRKAHMAFQSKNYGTSSYYSDMGHACTKKIKEANNDAAEELFESRNHDKSMFTIDLHALHVDEALGQLKKRINQVSALDRKRIRLEVITGTGYHSDRGKARIKPTVLKFLKDQSFNYEELSPGIVLVKIKS